MRKLGFFIVALLLILTNTYAADNVNTSATGTSQQTQSIINTGPAVQFNYPEDTKTNRVLSGPQAYPGGDWLQPSMIPMEGKPIVVQTTPYFSAEVRYSFDELQSIIKSGLDLVQERKGLKRHSNTAEKIYTLPGLLNEEPIKVLQIDGAVNGMWEKTELYAVSLAGFYGAYRVCIQLELVNNVQSVSNGVGSAAAGTALGGGDTAGSAAIAPRNGKAESRNFKVPVLKVYCYDKGWVPPAPNLLSSPALKSVLVVSLANGFPKDDELERVAALICTNRRNITVVTLVGISRDPAIQYITFEAMAKIGKKLRLCGYCPQQTIDLLQCKVVAGDSNIIRLEIQ